MKWVKIFRVKLGCCVRSRGVGMFFGASTKTCAWERHIWVSGCPAAGFSVDARGEGGGGPLGGLWGGRRWGRPGAKPNRFPTRRDQVISLEATSLPPSQHHYAHSLRQINGIVYMSIARPNFTFANENASWKSVAVGSCKQAWRARVSLIGRNNPFGIFLDTVAWPWVLSGPSPLIRVFLFSSFRFWHL